jgi:hypothetical protein
MPTTLARLPPHSCALIVEDEPVQGLALECAWRSWGVLGQLPWRWAQAERQQRG